MATIAGGTEITTAPSSSTAVSTDFLRRVPKNAAANLFRLTGTGIVALLLPPFLVRVLPTQTYGAWAIILQLTAYVAYFDFGIQTAVARFVAHAVELEDHKQRDGVLSTAVVLLLCATVLGLLLVGVLAWQLPHLFRTMPSSLYRPARLGLLFMGASSAIGLPLNTIHAYFTGLQKNEIPVIIALGNKLVMAMLVAAMVLKQWSLGAMGAATAAANLLSYAGAYAAWRRWAGEVRIRFALVSRLWMKQIAGYSGALMIWMAATVMISGLDLTIVGIFDYTATAYYAIAATLTNFFAQAFGAMLAPLLPVAAAMGARNESQRLGELLVSSTRYGMLILLVMGMPLIVAGHFIIRVWAGADYAAHSTRILEILVLANVVRLCALPYATLLLGTGQQSKVLLSPIAEGITNLAASVAGAYLFGAIGVAVGTLIGAFVSVALHYFYNLPRTFQISFSRVRLIREAILRPTVCALPTAATIAFYSLQPKPTVPPYLSIATTAGTVLLVWNVGLFRVDRQRFASLVRSGRWMCPN